MRLLLDTHVWIWSLSDLSRLADRVTRALVDSKNEIWLSPISTWEVLMLARKGRVTLLPSTEAWLHEAFSKPNLREGTFTHAVAEETARIALHHRDPADLILAATARVYGLTLVTSDERLLRAKEFDTLPNR